MGVIRLAHRAELLFKLTKRLGQKSSLLPTRFHTTSEIRQPALILNWLFYAENCQQIPNGLNLMRIDIREMLAKGSDYPSEVLRRDIDSFSAGCRDIAITEPRGELSLLTVSGRVLRRARIRGYTAGSDAVLAIGYNEGNIVALALCSNDRLSNSLQVYDRRLRFRSVIGHKVGLL